MSKARQFRWNIKYLDVGADSGSLCDCPSTARLARTLRHASSHGFSADGGEAAQLKYEFKNNETEPSGLPKNAVLAIPVTEKDSDLKSETAEEFAALVRHESRLVPEYIRDSRQARTESTD